MAMVRLVGAFAELPDVRAVLYAPAADRYASDPGVLSVGVGRQGVAKNRWWDTIKVLVAGVLSLFGATLGVENVQTGSVVI